MAMFDLLGLKPREAFKNGRPANATQAEVVS